MIQLPSALVSAIASGDCVAFVGAGFSAAANLPTWPRLLQHLAGAEGVPDDIRDHVRHKIEDGTSYALDEAAQILCDTLTRPIFLGALREALERTDLNERMEKRRSLLFGMPFRAILTTNFDTIIDGRSPDAATYRAILRAVPRPWWARLNWHGSTVTRPPLVKLHGDVREPDHVVFTRRDYRRLVHEDVNYVRFLRVLLARHPVLYLGFSFTDAYLNELRSEALALLGDGASGSPLAFAVVNDVPAPTRHHYRANEGIEILSYPARDDFWGFDRILEALHEATNPVLRFGALLKARRILWVDPHPENNEVVKAFLSAAERVASVSQHEVIERRHPADALATLSAGGPPVDLVITHWGEGLGSEGGSVAEELLTGLRARSLRAPVVIFSTDRNSAERRRAALALGAQEYCFTFPGLLLTLERLFGGGIEQVVAEQYPTHR